MDTLVLPTPAKLFPLCDILLFRIGVYLLCAGFMLLFRFVLLERLPALEGLFWWEFCMICILSDFKSV